MADISYHYATVGCNHTLIIFYLENILTFQQDICRASEMTQWAKTLPGKLGDLSLIPSDHIKV